MEREAMLLLAFTVPLLQLGEYHQLSAAMFSKILLMSG